MLAAGADLDLVALCERQHPVLVGALGLYLGDVHEAEDIAQDTMVRLCQHWPLAGVENPTAWVMRVGFNLATSSLRRRVTKRRAIDRLRAERPPATLDRDDVVFVRRAVLGLPDRQRQAIVLRYYAGLSVRETAAQLGCPENTVKTLVHQAVKALRTTGLEVSTDD